MMAVNSLFSRRPWSEDGGFGLPRSLGEEAHVLAVDDSIVDRKVIEKLLKIYSCKVTAVDSVKRALQFLGLDEEVTEKTSVVGGLKVDLIITDYSMPELTGYELLKKIKESSAFREIPVVIMSSENILARIDRCLEEGAEDFIVKPVKLSDMERLKQHLAAKNVSKSKDRALNNKRKQPDAPDLNASPTSPESPPSTASLSSESPVSSPSSESPASSPSSGSPASSPSSSGSPASSSSAPLSSAESPLLLPLSPYLPPPMSEPLDSPSIKLKWTIRSDEILSDYPL